MIPAVDGNARATLQRPGWPGNHVGFYPFPTGSADEKALEGDHQCST